VANQNFFGNMSGWGDFQTRVNRAALAVIATACLGVISACGGGGASTPAVSASADLSVLPGATDMFPNTPVTFTISGGSRPYTVVSSNSSILPLNITVSTGSTFVATASNPAVDTPVTITVRDATGKQATSAASVKTAVLLNAIQINPSINTGNACGGADVCTGNEAIARVTARANGGPLVGRTIRFEVLTGALGIVSGTTVVNSLNVNADSLGVAIATLRAPVGVPNQYSTIRATDVLSGQTVSYVLTIGQTIDPTAIAITPNAFTWTGAFKDSCVVGGLTSHLITGGTPPYSVGQSIPDYSILTGVPPGPPGQVVPARTVTTVGANFGSLLVVTTGSVCSSGAAGNIITVTDSIGRVATLNMGNVVGTADRPVGGPAVTLPVPTLTPNSFSGFACGQSSSTFVSQTIPSGYTGTPPVLSAVALEPNRITANLSAGILTVTRVNTDPGGSAQTRVRVSNGTNFSDLAIDLAGSAPFACVSGGGNTGTPITIGTGSALALTIAGQPTVNVTFDGGTGPYTVTSASPTYFQVSLDGVTFGTSVTVASGAARLYFVRAVTPVGVPLVPAAGNASFITIADSSTPAKTFVQIVTLN
jgi:hypothetical protein